MTTHEPLKTVCDPRTRKCYKLGRKRPRVPRMFRRAGDFLRLSLVSPASADFDVPEAAPILSDVMENDVLGDCVIAAGYHLVGVETANAGDPFHATTPQITSDYEAIGGYVPGEPSTDQGCDEGTAMSFWTQHGFANGTKLLGALSVNAKDRVEVQACMFACENLIFGMGLPDAWVTPFPSGDGFVWDVAGPSNDQNGHAVVGYGYNDKGVLIISWGMKGLITWEAIATYAIGEVGGQLFVALTPDQLAKGQAKAPNGVAWADIVAYFNSIGGHVPAPAPIPAPVPVPVPTPPAPAPAPSPTPTPEPPEPAPVKHGPTLEQAHEALATAFLHQPHGLTCTQAQTIAENAMTTLWNNAK